MPKPIDCYAPLAQFKTTVTQATRAQVRTYINSHAGINYFHYLLDQPAKKREETKAKVAFLMQHAKRLGLDPNEAINTHCQTHMPAHTLWDNTPLHQCISYENMDLIPFFLETAKKYGFEINLNIKDNAGKTPLMFAIKIGWTPVEIIQQLMTPENYNMPEKSGMTPIMLACALRRVDIVSLLIQAEADRLELGQIYFSNPTPEQIVGLAPFLSQVHPTSGKTLGHYAVMRSGNRDEQAKKPITYQETVLNILKAADIDGLRDENARYNCLTNSDRGPMLIASGIKGTPTQIAHIDIRDFGGQVFLSTLKNKTPLFQCDIGLLKPDLDVLFGGFSGQSLVRSICTNTQAMVNLLGRLNFDFSVAQKNGKTVAGYVDALKNPTFEKFITTLDRDNLFKLENIGRASHPNRFFAVAAAPEPEERAAAAEPEKALDLHN
jgi:hypothetical protein